SAAFTRRGTASSERVSPSEGSGLDDERHASTVVTSRAPRMTRRVTERRAFGLGVFSREGSAGVRTRECVAASFILPPFSRSPPRPWRGFLGRGFGRLLDGGRCGSRRERFVVRRPCWWGRSRRPD